MYCNSYLAFYSLCCVRTPVYHSDFSTSLKTTMAPVEVDSIPRSVIVPKTVEKALTLPIVSDTCSEVARCVEPLAPYMKTTYEKLSPVVEHGYNTVLAKYEDNVVPLLPVTVTETVAINLTAVGEYGKAVVGKVDILASDGIDQLSDKLPQLKESTPKLIADAKVRYELLKFFS